MTVQRRLPGWAWAVLVWLTVVAAASVLGWLAISRAGGEVLAAPVAPLTSAQDAASSTPTGTGTPDAGASGPTAAGGPPSSTGAGAVPPGATPSGDAGGSAAAAGTASPAVPSGQVITGAVPPPPPSTTAAPRTTAASPSQPAASSSSARSAGTPSSSSSSSAPAAPAAPAAQSQAVDASRVVTGGQVSVRCTGDVIQLRGATPSNGWSVAQEVRGGAEVRVEFRSDEGHSKVRATCAGGVPQMEVDDADD